MKKSLFLTIFIFLFSILFFSPTTKVYAESHTVNKVRVCVVQTYVYNSTSDFSEENILYTAKYNDVFNVIELFTQDNIKLYKISINDTYGYIDYYSVTNDETKSITTKLKENCLIIGNRNKDVVYLFEIYNNEFVQTDKTIEIGSRVSVLSDFSYNNEYNLIYYYDSNNNLEQGYVKTTYLRKDGIQLSLILGIGITSLAIIIAVIVLIIHLKKKAKK